MKQQKIYTTVISLTLLASCGNSSKTNSSGDYLFDDYPSKVSKEQQAQLVTCPMCNGTGIFDFMPEDVMAPKHTCSGCNGRGVCDVNTAQQIMQINSQFDGMTGGGSGKSGRSAYEIEKDLNKAYELLKSMEELYANTDGVVASSQYPRMISEQKERIRQLEAELRNAQ